MYVCTRVITKKYGAVLGLVPKWEKLFPLDMLNLKKNPLGYY